MYIMIIMTLAFYDVDALSTVCRILGWNQRPKWKHLDHPKSAEGHM